MQKNEVAQYLRETAGVEGWFFPIDALLFAIVDEIQKREGISGDLFEIGVHHGKTALFLTRMADAGERVGVCDVFERQDLNVDRSGEGSRAVFERNVRELGREVPLRVFAKLSSELTVDDTTDACRFFHIDGGHRPEDVYGDLEIAARALSGRGVVAVDDVFNPSWPGVSEGFYRFLRGRGDLFAPIAIGGNKVLLARSAAAKFYDDALSRLDEWSGFIAPQPFRLEHKGWMGRSVFTASRLAWVDLDPEGAWKMHAVGDGSRS